MKIALTEGKNHNDFPVAKQVSWNKKLSRTINERTNYIYMETNYGKLKSTDGA